MLNTRQKAIYDFIVEYKYKYSNSPSIRDICKAVGVKSTSTVSADLNVLEDLNFIRKRSQRSRSIELVEDIRLINREKEDTIDVPIIGSVAAGQPILAEENIEFFFPIPKHYENQGSLFILNIKGESMIEAGILDGDRVLVRQQNTADNGDIVVALIGDRSTVKTFWRENGVVKLIPHNSSMEPIVPDELQILGKVIALYRDKI